MFTGTNHFFRFNTSLFSGITYEDYCFYALNYDDVDNQIMSELRCRSNNPSQQVLECTSFKIIQHLLMFASFRSDAKRMGLN